MRKPLVIVFPITYKCNCKCVMCSIWKKQNTSELSLCKIRELFSEETLLRSIRSVNITGGEPTLRSDLSEIVKIIFSSCPKLDDLTISTNGIKTELIISQVEKILAELHENINFGINISLDGLGKTHDSIRNIPNAFAKVTSTIYEIKKLSSRYTNINCSLNMTITSYNYDQIFQVYNFAYENGIEASFTPAIETDIYINSKDCTNNYSLIPRQREKVAEYFEKLYKMKPNPYYKMVAEIFCGRARLMKCIFQSQGFILDVDGSVYPCGMGKDLLMGNIYSNLLSDIWSSPQADLARKKIFKKCSDCTSNCFFGYGTKNQAICYLKKQSKKYIPLQIQKHVRKLL